MIIFRFSAAALLLLAGCRGEDAAGDAQRLGLAFCRAVEAGEDMSAEALMAPGLRARVAQVRAADAAFRRANRAAQPPLGNGLQLTRTTVRPAACSPIVEGPDQVKLMYEATDAQPAQWSDRLLLVRGADGRLTIADIVYGLDDTQRFSGWIAENGGGRDAG